MEVLKQSGYTIKAACNAIGISRSGYYAGRKPKEKSEKVSELKDTGILEKIKAIKLDHPFWGYRRVRA
ncbi:MAG: hypothetical protein ACE5K2_05615 [Candidatus Zixiibacteriota bacterium]